MAEPNQNAVPAQAGEEWWFAAEPTHRRVRVEVGGETVADSRHVLVALEAGRLPVYYFPRGDVRFAFLRENGRRRADARKGEAVSLDIRAGGRVVEDGAWLYPDPAAQAGALKGAVAFDWNKADHWYEEEEEIFKHPRDPYHRVDALRSSRHVQVVLGGETVADSTRPVVVFETGLTPRYYLPAEDVRTEFLQPTATQTRCPYKGVASYWTAKAGGKVYEDVVWSYLDPVPEIPKIRGLLSFYNEKVDALLVDGEKWSLSPGDRLPSSMRPGR